MSATPVDPQAPQQNKPSQRPEWLKNLLVPVLVTVLGTLLVTVMTPAGAAVREFVFRTKAAVSGTVEMNGAPVGGAVVRLGDEASSTTDNAGRFQLSSVGAGEQRLHVEAPGARARDYEFTVASGASSADVGVIEVEPFVRLGYFASVKPPTRPGQSRVRYDVTLWLIGADDAMGTVRSVAYTLSPPLPRNQVSGSSLREAFCYRQQGSVGFEDLMVLGGAFAAASGKVELADGRSFPVSAAPGTEQPADCKARKSSSSNSGTGSGSGSNQNQDNSGNQGSQHVPIPDVARLSEDQAVALLRTAGFKTETERQPDENVEVGRAIGTKPAAANSATKGSTVTVLISAGGPPTVPNVIGQAEAAATAILEDAGFTVQRSESPDQNAAVAQVLNQKPSGGEEAPSGSAVSIVVATKP